MSSLLRLWTKWLSRDMREKPSDAPPTGFTHSTANSSSSPSSTTGVVGCSSPHTSWTPLLERPPPASLPAPPHLAQQRTLGTGASSKLPMVTTGQCCWRYSAARGVTDRVITEGRGVLMNSSTRSLNKCTFSKKTRGESSSSTDEPKDTRSSCSSCRKQDCYWLRFMPQEQKQKIIWLGKNWLKITNLFCFCFPDLF